MKKLALIAALAAVVSSPVMADGGVYVQGDLGYSHLRARDDMGKTNEDVFSPRLGVGYDFGNNFRTGLDYTHYNDIDNAYLENGNTIKSEAKVRSAGISAIYDIETGTAFKPYVGARVGFNKVSSRVETAPDADGIAYFARGKTTRTGLGAMTGVTYQVNENLGVEAGYRFNHLGKYQDMNLQSHEVSTGVRYRF